MTRSPVAVAIDQLDAALLDLDSARFALGSLVEEVNPDISPHVIRCIVNTLGEAASDAEAAWGVVQGELKATKTA